MLFRGGDLHQALYQPLTSGALASLRTALITAVTAACLAGCSSTRVTQPLLAGHDTYTVSARTSQGGTAPAREAAVLAASQQCSRLSKQLLLLKSSTDVGFNADQGVVDVNQGVVDVTFRCLAASDPELRRPSIRPDVVTRSGNASR
jgi:hypothetical protein